MFVFVIYSKQEVCAKNLELLCFWKSSEDCSDIFLLKQGNGKTPFWGVLWIDPKKCNKMAPFSKIFTIEVPKHDGQKEHTWLHNIFEFHDCSLCRFFAIHKRVKLNCKWVKNSLHGEGEIIWGLSAPCCPRDVIYIWKLSDNLILCLC